MTTHPRPLPRPRSGHRPRPHSGAVFSPDRRYRYLLWRRWSEAWAGGADGADMAPWALFILLNPSTADEVRNDPTVERCQRRAVRAGYGGMVVLNIFALRSTDPAALYKEEDPVGHRNDRYIRFAARRIPDVVCGWGIHGAHLDRGKEVLALLAESGARPQAFGVTKEGQPKHPLYLPYSLAPAPLMGSGRALT